jgi:glycolate oxidase FAD binding subunit
LLEEKPDSGSKGLVKRIRQAAQDLGGALLVEHCPEALKTEVDVWGPTGDDFAAMSKLKAVWDPMGILAPGRFVGGL